MPCPPGIEGLSHSTAIPEAQYPTEDKSDHARRARGLGCLYHSSYPTHFVCERDDAARGDSTRYPLVLTYHFFGTPMLIHWAWSREGMGKAPLSIKLQHSRTTRETLCQPPKENPAMICSCGKPIDSSAENCPGCGRTYLPLKVWMVGVWLPLAGLLLVIYSCVR